MAANARKVVTVAATAVGVGAGVWFSLILADLLTFWWTYTTVVSAVEIYGLSEYPAKLIGVGFAALVSYIANNILWNVIKRDKKWVPMLAGVMALWFVVMYSVSSPYTTSLFNPFSGEARAVYVKMPNGTIKKYPRTMKYDPDTGQKLEEFDAATAQEYQRQQARRTKASAFRWKTESKSGQVASSFEDANLALWVEGMTIGAQHTIVSLACEGKDGKAGWLLHIGAVSNFARNGYLYNFGQTDAYLVDDSGRTYALVSDSTVYDSTYVFPRMFWENEESFTAARYVHEDEIYRFKLIFTGLSKDVMHLRLHLQSFEPALELGPLLDEALVEGNSST